MAGRPLEIHPAALTELQSALSWYRQRSEAVALSFIAELDRAVDFIGKSPMRWPSGSNGTRKFPLRRFPFAVIYRETPASIQVLAVAHGHRRPGYWKERL